MPAATLSARPPGHLTMPTWFDTMMAWEGDEAEFEVRRVDIDEGGLSFSADALDALHDQLISWVGSRIMRRWQATNEPPTVVRVVIHVDVG